MDTQTGTRKQPTPPGILSKPDNLATRELAKTGNFYTYLREMSREFGDIVSLSPQLYLFGPAALVKETLKNAVDFRKADSIETFKVLVGEGLFTAQGKVYNQQERAVKTAFGRKYFAEFRRIIEEESEAYIDGRFSSPKKGSSDIVGLSVDLTMSIAARSFFGVGGETQLAQAFRKGLVFVQDWFAQLEAVDFAEPMLRYVEQRYLFLPIFESLQTLIFRRVSGSGEMAKAIASWKAYVQENEPAARKTAASMRDVCARIIELRRRDARWREKDDVLSSLLRLQADPENKWLTDAGIIDQVATFFVAGHETTSDLFTVLIWKHARGETPRAVAEELRNAADMINEEQFLFQKYPLANAYISEVLLDHPPVPFTVRQTNRDLEVGGYFIPKDSKILLAPFVTRDIDVTFGYGRRQCIGRVFALEEAVIGLRHLVRYKLELDDPAQAPEMTQGLTIGYSRSKIPIPAKPVAG